MANFILSILETTLGLTEDEKNTIEPCLPHAKAMLDQIDGVWPSVQQAAQLLEDNRTIVMRLLGDLEVILPNASALLGEGMYIDTGGALAKIKDLQSVVTANPKTFAAVREVCNALQPVIVSIAQDWPSVEPGYNVVIEVAKRKGYSLGSFIGGLHQALLTRRHDV